ncbi:MAG TPA: matrixin family metalloprotease [Gemmatimonadaceae bacterium]|nr:matrixin family metalloprotease [Gemmatimonadaceae bacterium]
MQFRSPLSLGRVLTFAVAFAATAGIVDCTAYSSAVGDGTLGNAFAAGAIRVPELNEIMLGARGTYIDRCLADRDSTIERWPDRTAQPLRVWIDSSGIVSGPRAAFPAAVRAAFSDWAATGIPVRFAFVSSPRNADVRVHWTERLDHKTGSTTWRTDRTGWLTDGDITLAMHMSTGMELNPREMHAIALHEVGHALGLSHSEDPRDIMAALVRVDQLSPADRATIELLYSLPAGHVQ